MLCVGFLFGFVRKSTHTRRAALMAIGRKKFNFFAAFEQLENWRIDGEQLASVECYGERAGEGREKERERREAPTMKATEIITKVL